MTPLRVALVLAVLLAGCGGSTVGDGGSAAPSTPSVTPAPVPTEVTPQAVAPDRVAAVPSTHAGALDGRSFTLTERLTVTTETGTVYDVERVLRVDSARDRYDYQRRRVADPVYPGPQGFDTLSMYHDGERVVFRFDDDGSVRYGVFDTPAPFGPVPDLDGVGYLRDVTAAFGNWTVTRPGDGTVRFESRSVLDPGVFPAEGVLGDPRSGGAELRVRGDGTVTRVAVEYVTTLNGGTVVVRSVRRYADVGATEVTRPAWYETALATAEEEP